MYERIARQIIDFEKRLSADEEVGGRFVASPREVVFHIKDIDYWNPDMLIFEGTDADGRCFHAAQPWHATAVTPPKAAGNRAEHPRSGQHRMPAD